MCICEQHIFSPNSGGLGLVPILLILLAILLVLLVLELGVQGMFGVVANSLDYTQAFRPALTEQYSVTHSQVLWSLHESECDLGSIACSYVLTVDVDDGACLGDRSDVQHRLVFGLNGGCM